jgi:hypothetical protein
MAIDVGEAAPEEYSIQRLTTLSPIRPKRLGSLRRRLAFVEWTPGVGRPLLELSTIHYARWIVLPALPHPDGSGRKRWLNWNYLLFHATYDGPQSVYLDTFGDDLPLRIARLFGTCFGFESRVEEAPGAEDRVFPTYAFRQFVTDNQLRELGFYERRPDPVRVVRQALAIERTEHRSDSGRVSLGAAQSEVESLALGAPLVKPGWAESLLGPSMRKARPSRSVNPLTVIAPLKEKAEPGARRLDGPLPSTRFASVVLIPRTMQARLGQRDPDLLPKDYLLFTTDFYGDPAGYIEEIRTHPQIDEIFACCLGFPGTTSPWAFRNWIARHSITTQYYVCGYPARPVEELDHLLAQRTEIARSLGSGNGPP